VTISKAATPNENSALAGVKILEIAHVIAGPLSGTLLGDVGADVIHLEDPRRGDALRVSGPERDGVGLWWKVTGRNKRSVTVDLRSAEGQELARRLVDWCDVLITNFRPDTLTEWGLDWETLHARKPTLICLQITGYGLNTSRRNDPGFGKAAEARSGVVAITGEAGGRPLFAGFSHGDAVTGLAGAMAVTTALYRKAVDPNFNGEHIDLALSDALFRLIEWQVIVHDQLGMVPTRAGNRPPIAPAAIVDTYMTRDDRYIVVTSATVKSVLNIAAMVGEEAELYASAALQQINLDRLDGKLKEWARSHDLDDCMVAARAAGVVASPIFTVEDIMADESYQERGLLVSVDDEDLGEIKMQGVVPRLTNHPGGIRRAGPRLGQDNEEVYGEILGLDEGEIEALKLRNVI
jgi:crotonobetainyl-CoA:carnitine CoA-transferase CaiB-like acyl-CoA transferase